MHTKIKISPYFIGLAIVIAATLVIWHFKNGQNISEQEVINVATSSPQNIKAQDPPAKIEPEIITEPEKEPKTYKSVITTLFWVGEDSDESNGFIPNHQSYWDSNWLEHYGGIDSPEKRCGYYPCGFTPKENPFYFALPYGDRNDNDTEKQSVKLIPWYKYVTAEESLIKNVWIEIKYGDNTCYAQWEDVGPFEIDDFSYVFGNTAPKNTFGVSSGLDISPAVWDCLGLNDNSVTKWRFVTEKDVPEGPWKLIITTRGLSF